MLVVSGAKHFNPVLEINRVASYAVGIESYCSVYLVQCTMVLSRR